MIDRKWAYKPGELAEDGAMLNKSDVLTESFLDLTERYSELATAKRVIVLTDNKETVFFAQLNDDMISTKRVDVYVWDTEEYKLLPQDLSIKASNKYFDYVDAMGEVYEWLEGENLS